MRRFCENLGWNPAALSGGDKYVAAAPMTAYNAITPIEATAVERLVKNVQSRPGGRKLDTVMWSASGSEAIQKALWACLHRNPQRDMILATRHGFHGKKGLAGAVTGSESDHDRDPRVRFISFPMAEVDDVSRYDETFDGSRYQNELEALWKEFGPRINCLITEPYLGGGGSYHPPSAYLKLLELFCRRHDILFVLDEVQSNFGRTGSMYAFETHGIEPDFVCLGKGLGNGIPVSAVVGRGDVLASLTYGERLRIRGAAIPIACAAVRGDPRRIRERAACSSCHAERLADFLPRAVAAERDVARHEGAGRGNGLRHRVRAGSRPDGQRGRQQGGRNVLSR